MLCAHDDDGLASAGLAATRNCSVLSFAILVLAVLYSTGLFGDLFYTNSRIKIFQKNNSTIILRFNSDWIIELVSVVNYYEQCEREES